MDYKELGRKIETFSLDDGDLGSQGYERVLLQLFGYTGHGKSSFINSCMYVLNDGGPFVEHAQAGHREDGGSMTLIRKAFELTSNITLVDNRGFGKMNKFERAEVYAQLGNFYPLDQHVEWKENFKEAMSALVETDWDSNTTDFLVPIFIFSAAQIMSPEGDQKIKAFLQNCDLMTGVFPIIVLTHKTQGNLIEVEKKFRLMGVETVITIENYTKDSHVKTLGKSADILRVIQMALENVTFHLSLPRDPKRDQKERKKFLLNYIHEAVLKKEKEKAMFDILSQKREEKKEPGFYESYCVLL